MTPFASERTPLAPSTSKGEGGGDSSYGCCCNETDMIPVLVVIPPLPAGLTGECETERDNSCETAIKFVAPDRPRQQVAKQPLVEKEYVDPATDNGATCSNSLPLRPDLPLDPPSQHARSTTPPLTLWPLAVLVFYSVSGGPFGIEPSIRAAGNLYAILGFLIAPLVWSIPEALITAELGASFRDPSAGVAWVEEAFGESAGALCGYLGWISGATDNAIYPTLFLDYLSSVAGWNLGGWERFGFIVSLTMALALLNYRGLEIVGNASLVVCFIAMSPFVLLTILGASKVQPSRWLKMPENYLDEGSDMSLFDDDFETAPGPLPLIALGGVLWRPYLNNLFWNLNSYDAAASFAAETTDVRSTFPRGIFWGVAFCTLSYLAPLLVATGATDYEQSEWVDGHLGTIAVDIGGAWLGGWTIFSAGISNLALFEAELSADAFQLMGMADRGHIPSIFGRRSKYGTPTVGIIVGTFVIMAFAGCADFGQLLELLNANYAISLLMEYAAFVKLRLYHKDLERPFRIPIPDWAAVLLVLPPTLGIFVIFAISNWYVFAFSFGSIVVGYLLFQFGRVVKRKKWFAFNERNPVLRYSEYAVAPAATADDTTDPSSTEESYSSSPDIGVGNAEGCFHGSDPPWEYPKEGDVEFQVIDTAAEERDIL